MSTLRVNCFDDVILYKKNPSVCRGSITRGGHKNKLFVFVLAFILAIIDFLKLGVDDVIRCGFC